MTVLITGGAGFIGSTLTQRLLKMEHDVAVIDNFNDYYNPRFKRENVKEFISKPNYTLYEGDAGDREFLTHVFDKKKYSHVVHLAASVGVRNSLLHPKEYYQNNVTATKMLLNEAARRGIGQFLFASSSSVYGNNSTIPFREDAVADGELSPYAQTKKEAEAVCKAYHEEHGLPITVFRFFTVYGPKGRPDMSPYIFIDAILNGKKITIFGDGTAKRDFTFAHDIVDGIIRGMGKSFPFEIFNLGASSPVDMLSFVRLMERIAHKKAKLEFAAAFLAEMRHTFANIEKAKTLLGYKPRVSLEEGMDTFIRWFKKCRTLR